MFLIDCIMKKSLSDKNQGSFIKSVFILGLGGFIAKLLGAFYRIPLTNIIGSYGMGIYQLVFPLFSLLLTISTAGIPVAVSKLVAEKAALRQYRQANKVFATALAMLAAFGLCGSALLFFMADNIAALQGNADASSAYKLIAPAVFLVCVISAYRGYFQGLMQMTPTAVSQIVEQVVKMAVGLYCAVRFMPDVIKSVNYAILGVTLSEAAAVILLFIMYLSQKSKPRPPELSAQPFDRRHTVRTLMVLCLPITLSGLIIPLTQLVDSVLVLNLLQASNSTELYGLWAGPVHSLLNMPVVLTLGIATAIVPAVSKHYARGDEEGAKQKAAFSIKLTVVLGLPCSLGLIALAEPITKLLYGGLSYEEILISADMVRVAGVSVLFLSLVQTSTAVLQAGGRLYAPVVFLFLATAVKTALSVVLLGNGAVNIFGAPLSSVICYFVACLLDLVYIVRKQKVKLDLNDTLLKPLACGLTMTVFLLATKDLCARFMPNFLCVFTLIGVGALIYGVMLPMLKVFDKKEAERVPLVGKYLSKMYREK